MSLLFRTHSGLIKAILSKQPCICHIKNLINTILLQLAWKNITGSTEEFISQVLWHIFYLYQIDVFIRYMYLRSWHTWNTCLMLSYFLGASTDCLNIFPLYFCQNNRSAYCSSSLSIRSSFFLLLLRSCSSPLMPQIITGAHLQVGKKKKTTKTSHAGKKKQTSVLSC